MQAYPSSSSSGVRTTRRASGAVRRRRGGCWTRGRGTGCLPARGLRPLSLDRVGRWSVEKLEMLSEDSHAYAVIMNAQKRSRPGRRAWVPGFYYVDTFAGPGIAESKADPEVIEYLEGSPLRAVDCSPPFDH